MNKMKWKCDASGEHKMWINGTIPLSIKKGAYRKEWYACVGDTVIAKYDSLKQAKIGIVKLVVEAVKDYEKNPLK